MPAFEIQPTPTNNAPDSANNGEDTPPEEGLPSTAQSVYESTVEGIGFRMGYTKAQVTEVKLVLRLLPIFALSIVYWAVYNQMFSYFLAQA